MNTNNKNSFVVGVMLIIILLLIIALAYVGLHKLNPNTAPANVGNNATSTVATSTPDNVPAEWPTYVNNAFNYQFRYPSSVTLQKNISVPSEDGVEYVTYTAGNPIQVSIQDHSTSENLQTGSVLVVSPLYVGVRVERKPSGFVSLKNYVDNYVNNTLAQGQHSAAGIYATSTATTLNGVAGYKVVVSDGSVVQTRDENYFLEKGDYIFKLDIPYSGYAYENKDSNELTRVDFGRQIISSFRFIQ